MRRVSSILVLLLAALLVVKPCAAVAKAVLQADMAAGGEISQADRAAGSGVSVAMAGAEAGLGQHHCNKPGDCVVALRARALSRPEQVLLQRDKALSRPDLLLWQPVSASGLSPPGKVRAHAPACRERLHRICRLLL